MQTPRRIARPCARAPVLPGGGGAEARDDAPEATKGALLGEADAPSVRVDVCDRVRRCVVLADCAAASGRPQAASNASPAATASAAARRWPARARTMDDRLAATAKPGGGIIYRRNNKVSGMATREARERGEFICDGQNARGAALCCTVI